MMNFEKEKNSKVMSAEPPPPRTLLSRDELEGILSVVLNGLCPCVHPMDSTVENGGRKTTLESKALTPLSQDELEKVLTVMAGDLWKPRFG
jgi:hypothetical protein